MTVTASLEGLFEVEPGEARAPGSAAPAGAGKTFRGYDQGQCFLLPPSLDDWLDEDDEARFISEVVEELLDLTPVYASYASASGAPPYDPRMMLKLLLFAYATGVTSSRELERRCKRDIAFRWLSGNQAPDYRSLARFRRRHLDALPGLFLQVLRVCAEAGLVRLGRVALDGTKLAANASRHKAMSYDRIVPKIDQLKPRSLRCSPRRRRSMRPRISSSARTGAGTRSPRSWPAVRGAWQNYVPRRTRSRPTPPRRRQPWRGRRPTPPVSP